MIRKIINIDEEKCNGCGACADACHEGAIQMVNGKAKLMRDDYCDGLGDCLPVCPTEAITFIEREALEYSEEAVKENQNKKQPEKLACGCPGTNMKSIKRAEKECECKSEPKPIPKSNQESELSQWPVQIKLVPANAPYFENADLLIAADCTAYAYGDFHRDFIKNHITLIGCPKLDMVDYTEKLMAILKMNTVNSITVTRMEVPCCGGIEAAVKNAVIASGRYVNVNVVTISTDGKIL